MIGERNFLSGDSTSMQLKTYHDFFKARNYFNDNFDLELHKQEKNKYKDTFLLISLLDNLIGHTDPNGRVQTNSLHKLLEYSRSLPLKKDENGDEYFEITASSTTQYYNGDCSETCEFNYRVWCAPVKEGSENYKIKNWDTWKQLYRDGAPKNYIEKVLLDKNAEQQ